MPELGLALVAIVCGIVGLVWSADRFIDGSAAIARSFGMSALVVGLTVVSLGTSAPEVMISISASTRDAGELAVGNAIGSNLANIGLVLGVTALLVRLPIQRHILRHELPILLLVTLLGGIALSDGHLARWEGSALLACLLPALAYLVWAKKREMTPREMEEEQRLIQPMPRWRALTWFAVGLVLLIISAEVLVWGAKTAALAFRVDPLVIGLTLVAVGTSLPELAASVVSARKGLQDIALGNIVGSNIFNLLVVMALPGLIDSPDMAHAAFSRDYLTMGLLTLLLAAAIIWQFARARIGGAGLGRQLGILLLVCYAGYYVILFNTAERTDTASPAVETGQLSP